MQDEIKKIKNDLIEQEKITSVINKIVERMDVMILINQHENGFLVPLNTITSLNPTGGDDYVIVQILSPKIAISFMAEISSLSFSKSSTFTGKRYVQLKAFTLPGTFTRSLSIFSA